MAWSSCDEELVALGQLPLQGGGVLLHGGLGLVGGLGGLEGERLEVLDLLLDGDEPVGERLGGRRVLLDLGGVALLGRLVGHEHGLPGVADDLLELLHGAVEAHLGLLLVGDDVGGLLPEPPVLVLRLGDRLLELDLRVGLLVERPS